MDLGDLLAPDGVISSLKATCKKQVLQELAEHASKLTKLEPREIYDTLLQRERLGSTGLGRGIAILYSGRFRVPPFHERKNADQGG